MRSILLFLIILCGLASCNNYNRDLKEDPSDKKIRKLALAIAEDYSMKQNKDLTRTVDEQGIINLAGKGVLYQIDPSKIVLGEINGDSFKDAIVPLIIFREPSNPMMAHLVLINRNRKLINIKVMDNVLKIIEIKDKIIYAEVSTVTPDSPLFGCEMCREVIKYQLKGDTLSLIK